MKLHRFLTLLSLGLILALPVAARAQNPVETHTNQTYPDETYPVEYMQESEGTCAYPEEEYYEEPVITTTETDYGICKAEDALGCEGAVVALAGPAAPVGNLQSPIDLFQRPGNPAAPWQFELRNYHNNHAWNVVQKHGHNVYEIQHLAWPWKPFAWVNGRQYLLRQFHCHNGPEHWVRGNRMGTFFECHFVHEYEGSPDKDKAVLGVYLLVPPAVDYIVPPQIQLPPGLLVPCAPWKYTYWGSLTADGNNPPPFPEGVAWMVPWDAFKDVDVMFRNYLYRQAPHPVVRTPLQTQNVSEVRIIP